MQQDQNSLDAPLLPIAKGQEGGPPGFLQLHRKAVLRTVVLFGILCGAAVLAALLPVSKYLPCPYCTISSYIGWTYFLMWSASFYPQLIINWRRKSVAGVSFDFLAFNVAGFACYSVFNLALKFSPVVQKEYHQRFGPVAPVELNDVFFGLHALVLSLLLAGQCLFYKRAPQQRLSSPTVLALGLAAAAAGGFAAILFLQAEGDAPFTWLDLCYMCSFVKMGVTLVKYIPQVHLNNARQSTEGWSIDNVLLDLGGGLLSTAQLLVTCQVLHDYSPVLGNPIKFGLGLTSVGFDIVFILQHYVWYRHLSPTAAAAVVQQRGEAAVVPAGVGAAADAPAVVGRSNGPVQLS
ncbi:PQ loop repeat-domain-containing protein [Scenedesmus sp. NREL 46B-D3]|nr:PQ loop repeat-domain-containing protein [Scenedesmus sp. NREL 46B-D3]